ncbi:MAG: SDR family NAD(P)-dependent oxidoreductase [Pseudomonadales bacterium]|nr:SDR family NAD(P)-dependent oxidoreductase [Pseudomonadales bacterium]
MKKTILISGASSGLGLAKSQYLQALGHQVFAGVRKQKDFDQLSSLGLSPIMLDVNESDTLHSAYEQIQAAGGLDILINNAGVAYTGPVEVMPEQDIINTINTNVIGAIICSKIFLPLLRQSEGRILNIGSISGIFAPPGLSVYAASKFALEGFSDALRVELAAFNIKVCIIEAGKIATPIWDKGLSRAEQVNDSKGIKHYEKMHAFYSDYSQNAADLPMHKYLNVVEKALFSPRPKPRYLLNNASRLRVFINRLPTPLRDAIIRKSMKI